MGVEAMHAMFAKAHIQIVKFYSDNYAASLYTNSGAKISMIGQFWAIYNLQFSFCARGSTVITFCSDNLRIAYCSGIKFNVQNVLCAQTLFVEMPKIADAMNM